jgi:hypothetical protein
MSGEAWRLSLVSNWSQEDAMSPLTLALTFVLTQPAAVSAQAVRLPAR